MPKKRDWDKELIELLLQALGKENKCDRCGKPDVSVSHTKPIFQGGKNELSNIEFLCRSCMRDSHSLGFEHGNKTDYNRKYLMWYWRHHPEKYKKYLIDIRARGRVKNLAKRFGRTCHICDKKITMKNMGEFKICYDIEVEKKLQNPYAQIGNWDGWIMYDLYPKYIRILCLEHCHDYIAKKGIDKVGFADLFNFALRKPHQDDLLNTFRKYIAFYQAQKKDDLLSVEQEDFIKEHPELFK